MYNSADSLELKVSRVAPLLIGYNVSNSFEIKEKNIKLVLHTLNRDLIAETCN